jgi:hypothetical protein
LSPSRSWECIIATKKPFSILYVTNQAEGADQGSSFNTSGHDNQLIIDKGMGKGDHQTPQEFGTKYGTNGVIAISHVEHVTPLTQQLQQKPLT